MVMKAKGGKGEKGLESQWLKGVIRDFPITLSLKQDYLSG